MARRKKKLGYLRRLQGLSRVQALVIVAIIILVGGGLYFTKAWEKIPFLKKTLQSVSGEAVIDLPRTKVVVLEPKKDNVVFLTDAQNVLITLKVPKGSVIKNIPLKLSPLENGVGVQIGQAESQSLFPIPVSLTFDLSKSSLTNSNNGKAHIYVKDGSKKTSILVARGVETDKFVVARILKSGTYVLDLSGREQVGVAEATLADSESSNISKIEAATALINQGGRLTSEQKAAAETSVSNILKKTGAPITEFAAALYLKERLNSQTVSFVKVAYAQNPETLATIERLCSEKKSDRFEDFLELLNVLELIGASQETKAICENAAIVVANRVADKVIANRSVSFGEVFDLLVRVKNLLPDEAALIDKLNKKVIEVLERDLKAVNNRDSSTINEIEEVIANADLVEGENESLVKQLKDKLKKKAEEEVKKILAKDCVTQVELDYAKILVEKYNLTFLKSDVDLKKVNENCGQAGIVIVERGGQPVSQHPLSDGQCDFGPEPPLPFSVHFETHEGYEYARFCYHTYTGYAQDRYIDFGFESGNPYQCEDFSSFAAEAARYDEMVATWDVWSNKIDDCEGRRRYTDAFDDLVETGDWNAFLEYLRSQGVDTSDFEGPYAPPEIEPLDPELEEPPLEDINEPPEPPLEDITE